MRRAGLAVALTILFGLASGAAAQSGSADPQSLVGEWWGQWTQAAGTQHPFGGPYYLTIERVIGNKVYGKVSWSGRSTSELKVSGTLSGQALSFGRTQLTIDGETMRGTWDLQSGAQRTISVSKRK
jgi:hypothetical protein